MAQSLSLAEQFFKQCQESNDPITLFKSFIAERKPETEWLDFKQLPKDEAGLKAIWFKALSGFANTEGGVIFWGIEADDAGDKIDCAKILRPFPDFERVASRLRELAREGTNPPVQGLKYLTFSDGTPENKGYIVCFVPESGYKPHRAETKDSKQYFIRASDSFQVANPAHLRQMFHPRIQPYFMIESDLSFREGEEHNQGRFELNCRIALKNVGTGSAHDCMVHVDHLAVLNKSVEDFKPRWIDFENTTRGLYFHSVSVIHPDFSLALCTIKWTVAAQQVWSTQSYDIPAIDKYEVELSIYARDMTPQKVRVCFECRLFRGKRWVDGIVMPQRVYED